MNKNLILLKNNRDYYILFLSIILIPILFYLLYINIPSSENRLKNLLLNYSIDLIDKTSKKVLEDMIDKNIDFVESNLDNIALRIKNEKILSFFRTKEIQELFVVFPSNERLFFLLDTADKERGEVGELFIPEEMDLYQEVLLKGKRVTYIQDNVDELGFTLIQPIVQEGKVKAFLVVDYTEGSLSFISKSLTNTITIVLFVVMLFLMLIALYPFFKRRSNYKIYYNPRTNTLNRRYLRDNYEKIEFAKYYVALADLDFFKQINSEYGRENGDVLLESVIKTINILLKKEDIFIEYSGESFLLFILKSETTENEFKKLLETICKHIERKSFRLPHKRVNLTISIGAILDTELEKSLHDVIHKADTALYETKHLGRNRVGYFDMTQSQKLYREKLKELIESDKLVCHYQPIVNLEDLSLHHYEALLRIEDGDNIIFPDKILPNLEDSHLYSYMSKKIIEFNVKKLHENKKMKISINLSADDLLNDSVLALFAESADVADRLQIELLENKSIDYNKVEIALQKLKLFGYKIAMDDFGVGYSNVNHLLNLSIDFLKIDGSLIRDIHHNKRAYTLVKTFANFCKENNIPVIAEFVENEDILNVLKKIGIEYGQGYHFSKPLPYDELEFDD